MHGVGSTRLHLDITSAVNILAYSSGEVGALWHIFRAEDLDGLRKYLRSIPEYMTGRDPIHSQAVYVTPRMLADLQSLGVKPFVVEQKLGDAVFIPAGCAHEVSGQTYIGLFPLSELFYRSATGLHASRSHAISSASSLYATVR